MQAVFVVKGKEFVVTEEDVKRFFKTQERYTSDENQKMLIIALEMLALKGMEDAK